MNYKGYKKTNFFTQLYNKKRRVYENNGIFYVVVQNEWQRVERYQLNQFELFFRVIYNHFENEKCWVVDENKGEYGDWYTQEELLEIEKTKPLKLDCGCTNIATILYRKDGTIDVEYY